MRRRRPRALLVTAGACALAGAVLAAPVGSSAAAGSTSAYLVVYSGAAASEAAAAQVAGAHGTLVATYPQIGVVVARSSDPGFAAAMTGSPGVLGAAATSGLGTRLDDVQTDAGTAGAGPAGPTTSDSLSGLQWDMVQMKADQAHAVTTGSPGVTVGDIDTGLDWTHPDLAANVDFAASASCVGGAADPDPAAWLDDNGHGTHTAGTIAAAANGIGIVGVAPGVKVAGIKAGDAAGFFFPEAVVCAFMWAGTHHLPVTNNSYFADPWLFNCRNDSAQRAIWTAERRAIAFAQSAGTLVVAAAGNQADDLAHPTADATSPDDTNPVLRQIHNDCAVVPTEVPGVVGVSADGNLGIKSFYSSYGVGAVDVMAPGGDSVLQRTAAAPNGRVLSTWPAALIGLCRRPVVEPGGGAYCYAQGTSMASPHVAGLAALVDSVHPGIRPGAAAALLGQSADPVPCPPDLGVYAFFPALDNGAAQSCTGGAGSNSFAGKGQVDALRAVG